MEGTFVGFDDKVKAGFVKAVFESLAFGGWSKNQKSITMFQEGDANISKLKVKIAKCIANSPDNKMSEAEAFAAIERNNAEELGNLAYDSLILEKFEKTEPFSVNGVSARPMFIPEKGLSIHGGTIDANGVMQGGKVVFYATNVKFKGTDNSSTLTGQRGLSTDVKLLTGLVSETTYKNISSQLDEIVAAGGGEATADQKAAAAKVDTE